MKAGFGGCIHNGVGDEELPAVTENAGLAVLARRFGELRAIAFGQYAINTPSTRKWGNSELTNLQKFLLTPGCALGIIIVAA